MDRLSLVAISIGVILLAAAAAWFLMRAPAARLVVPVDSMPAAAISKPARPPFSAPTWSARGDWAIPFAVRYAISFVASDGAEGPMSDWGPYLRSSQFSNPILSRFPVTLQPEGVPPVAGVKIYRQFEGHQPIYLDSVPYPYLNRYTVDFSFGGDGKVYCVGGGEGDRGGDPVCYGNVVEVPTDVQAGDVIECLADFDRHLWTFDRVRRDKTNPNAQWIVDNIIQSIKDNITTDELIRTLGGRGVRK